MQPRLRSTESVVSIELLLLVTAWVLVFRGPLLELLEFVPKESFRLHLVLAVGLVVLALVRVRRPVAWRASPRPAPIALLVCACTAHVANQHTRDIMIGSSVLMVIAAHAIAGLYLPAERWRQGIPLVVASIGLLPIGETLDIYLGFPLRVATARATGALLPSFGLHAVSAETILVIEQAGVQVDLPCSGVRSLWVGAVFWAAASFIERTPIRGAWFIAGLAFAILLLALNGVRVLALVVLHALTPETFVHVLHAPLGLIAFVTACAAGWGALRLLTGEASGSSLPVDAAVDAAMTSSRARCCVAVMAVVLLGLAAVPGPHRVANPRAVDLLSLPETWTRPDRFRPGELALFQSRGADAIGKWRFRIGEVEGELLLVESRSWRSQHRPDACHAAAGRTILADTPNLIAPAPSAPKGRVAPSAPKGRVAPSAPKGRMAFPVRRLEVGQGEAVWTGYYWFQSARTTTDDYSARIWSALDGEAEPWVMVSLIVDGNPSNASLRDVLLQIHAEVDEHLRVHAHS